MKIGIIGAGAIGLLYGGKLSKNHEVYLLESSFSAVNQINNEGVTVIENNVAQTYHPKAFLTGTCIEAMDVVFIAVKANYTRQALEQNVQILGQDTYLISIQNGLGNESILCDYVDYKHLVMGITRNNAIKKSSSTTQRMNNGNTELGFNKMNEGFVRYFVNELKEVGLDAKVSSEIEREIWRKLLLNITVNPLCSIYDCTIGKCYTDESIASITKQIIDEAVEVAGACGYEFDANTIFEENKKFAMSSMDGRPSMWQDVKKCRKTEIAFLNEIICELGKKYNVPTKMNADITFKIREIESEY